MNALLEALDRREFPVEISKPVPAEESRYGGSTKRISSKTRVSILGSLIEFSIEEGYDSVTINTDENNTEMDDDETTWRYRPAPQVVREPNGLLSLKINSYIPGQRRSTWSDGKHQRVEGCLGKFIVGLIAGAERLRLDREMKLKDEQARIKRQQELAEEEVRNAIEMEKREALKALVGSLVYADQILEYVSQVESAAHCRGEEISRTSELGQWLQWARNYSDQIRIETLGASPSKPDKPRDTREQNSWVR